MPDDLRKLAVDLSRAPAHVQRDAPRVVARAGRELQSVAQAMCPAERGVLRGSITTTLSSRGLTAEVGPTAYYGRFVEDGTYKMEPRPFMAPALERVEPRFAADMLKMAGSGLW